MSETSGQPRDQPRPATDLDHPQNSDGKNPQSDEKDRQQQQGKSQQDQSQPPKTAEQREDERFRQQAGMPKERAMQLLDALQQNEKAEQKKLLLARRAQRKGGKDW